jgi:histidinol phosphatase-like PHP family hydrolase
MIDLHMHSLMSDGELIPAELVQRAKVAGYRVMAITDHADQSNLEEMVPAIVRAAMALSAGSGLQVLAGCELTHVPPGQIAGLILRARELGARIVVVHGETPVEPVPAGTNAAAIAGRADILAHPGFITPAEARLAKRNGVALELTSRAGHSLTNGYVARTALQAGCGLVVNSDTHAPQNLHSPDLIKKVVLGAGLAAAMVKACQDQAWAICRKTDHTKTIKKGEPSWPRK